MRPRCASSLTLVLVVVAPISGRLTNPLPLREPLADLVLIGAGLLLMRAVDTDSEWTVLLPGLLAGGLAIESSARRSRRRQ